MFVSVGAERRGSSFAAQGLPNDVYLMMVVLTTIVMIASVLFGLRYWGVLFAVATTTYQFSSVFGVSFSVSVVLNSLPVFYLLPWLFLKHRYEFTVFDIFLILWISGFAINLLSSYSIEGPLEFLLRTVFLCGGYYLLGRLLAMEDDRGYRYLQQYVPALVLLTLFFATLAQDISQQDIASQLKFDEVAEETQGAGRLAVGEGNPVGYSAAINTAASATIGLFCATVFARGIAAPAVTILATVSSILLIVVAFAAGTRGVVVALIGVFVFISMLATMRGSGFSYRMMVVTLGAAAIVLGYLALPSILLWLAELIGNNFGIEHAEPLRQLALMLGDSDAVARDPSAAGRLEFWYIGWKLIQDSPLFGVPTDYLILNGFEAHNLFLQQWVYAGLLGILGAIMLVISTLFAALRLVEAKDKRIVLVGICHVAIFVGFLIQAQFSFSIYHAKMMFLSAGIVIGLDRMLRPQKRSTQLPADSLIRAASAE